MQHDPTAMVAGGAMVFFWAVAISVLFAIGNYHVAKRIEGASPVLWAVLSLIPMINYVFLFYVGYRVICTVLDRLNDVTRSERRPPRNESPL